MVSVYSVAVGAYIMHEPAGDDTKHVSVVPTLVVSAGHEPFSIVIYGSSTATKPAGHDTDGASAYAAVINSNAKNINHFILNHQVQKTSQT